MKLTPLVFLLLNCYALFFSAQNQQSLKEAFPEPSPFPNTMDQFFDRFGNKYRLEDLRIDKPSSNGARTIPAGTGLAQPQGITSFTTCSSGYFKLYFETGSGMEGNSSIEISRRNVICQVFSDLSQFFSSPLSANGGQVNIFIRDISNMGLANPANNLTLGLGTPIFNIPTMQNVGGIADDLVWQTITSGTDAYTGVANPLISSFSGFGSFYHGMLSLNFSNPAVNWNLQLGAAPAANEIDLYSVALHETTHALGFYSLIDQNGQSYFGAGYPYFSRYDAYLKTQNGTALITNTNSGCGNSRYNYNWNTVLSPSVLQPGFTSPNACTPDNTNCSNAIRFVGSITQPVYTPDCFATGSTLSHFEDQCAPALPGNNLYFVMCNTGSTGPQYMKRYYKPEERSALCDIGYSCANSYGSPVNLNNYSYSGPACPGAQVAGINDGINPQGGYTYTATVGAGVTLAGMLANDRFSSASGNSFKCLEVLSGAGSLSNVSGTSSTFTPSAGGQHVLRYIPVDGATGKEGNITYIYVFAQYSQTVACTPDLCNIVNNGGFERGTGCGQYIVEPVTIDCWSTLIGSPDHYVRNCTPTLAPAMTVPTTFCSPPADTWDNGTLGNNTFLGMWNYNNGCEAFQNQLSSPLMPNVTYTLSFWARMANNFQTNVSPGYIVFGGSPGLIPFNFTIVPTGLPSTASQLTVVPISGANNWMYFTTTLTNTTSTPFGVLSIYNAGWLTAPGSTYILMDDISIVASNSGVAFNPPAILCQNQAIINLNAYTSIPGGTFFGTGVTQNAITGLYEFNANNNLPLGTYQIVYKTDSVNGCSTMLTQTITLTNRLTSSSSTSLCMGQSATLTATGATTYSWSTGITNSVIVVSPTVTSSYTVSGTSPANSCTLVQVTTVSVLPVPPTVIIPATGNICKGVSATLTAAGADTYTWNTAATTTFIVISPTISTVYTVTGRQQSDGCSAAKIVTIVVSPCTGMDEQSIDPQDLGIYPNPTNGKLFIETRLPVKLILYNETGTSIREEELPKGTHILDLAHYAPGVYLLKARQQQAVRTLKLIKTD